MNNIPLKVLDTALCVLSHHVYRLRSYGSSGQYRDWPEDEWVSLGSEYDLNLYNELDKDNNPYIGADIYPVLNGFTNTEEWKTIFRLSYS